MACEKSNVNGEVEDNHQWTLPAEDKQLGELVQSSRLERTDDIPIFADRELTVEQAKNQYIEAAIETALGEDGISELEHAPLTSCGQNLTKMVKADYLRDAIHIIELNHSMQPCEPDSLYHFGLYEFPLTNTTIKVR